LDVYPIPSGPQAAVGWLNDIFQDWDVSAINGETEAIVLEDRPKSWTTNQTAFVRNYIRSVLVRLNDARDEEGSGSGGGSDDPFVPSYHSKDFAESTGVVNLHGQVQSAVFAGLNDVLIPVDNLKIYLKDHLASMTSLDLSGNNLLDSDLETILDLKKRAPKLTSIDLSHNRIYGAKETSLVDARLNDLLFQNVSLIIVGCPLASIDRRSFFDKLSDDQLRFLIWIPEAGSRQGVGFMFSRKTR
jgi:hypothetical protein